MTKTPQTFLFSGVPGVGKTSIVKAVAKKFNLPVYNFGDVLFKLVKKNHPKYKSVDEVRLKLGYEEYESLQTQAAMEIASHMNEDKIVVSHLAIATKTGFKPGFPNKVTKILRPTTVFVIESPVTEIVTRRLEDKSRQRGNYLEDQVEFHQCYNRALAAAYAFSLGHYVYCISNEQGRMDESIDQACSVVETLLK